MTCPSRLLLNIFQLYFLLGKAREGYLSQWFCKCIFFFVSEWLFTLCLTPKPVSKAGVRGTVMVGTRQARLEPTQPPAPSPAADPPSLWAGLGQGDNGGLSSSLLPFSLCLAPLRKGTLAHRHIGLQVHAPPLPSSLNSTCP